jgi:superfamily II DNA or RNA helicase
LKESRAYQLAMENDIPRYLKQYGSVIVQSPTGSGKSHIINKTVKRIITAGKIPLVMSDNVKIHSQLVTECNAMRLDSGVRRATILDGYPYVAMVQSLRNREHIIQQFKTVGSRLVVMVDECHRNTPTPLIHDLDPQWLIGFSATPHYKWAKHLPKLYASLIHGPQINTLVGDGYLAHYRHVIRTGANLDELEIRGNEYTEESQERVFGSKRMYDGIFEDLPKYQGKKTVIYVASIKQCEDMYSKLLAMGYRVCRYHSQLKNSFYELSRFTELNECDVCVSVSSLTLGWDYPPIDLVILWRATTSLPLYLQICGRGGRPWPGKEQFTVLDYGGNYEKFGAWDMDRDWNEMWQDPKNKRKLSTYAGVAGSKYCPLCQALLAVTARACYNCGYIFPESEIQLVEGQLVEVKNTLNALKERRVSELSAEELANYAKFNNKQMYATRIARAKEQDEPGFLAAFAKFMDYHKKWVDRQMERMPNDKIDFFDIIIR